MPDIPAEAVSLAAAAIERELMSGRDYSMAADSDEALARAALEAAAPVLERAWRRKMARDILALDQEESRLKKAGARNVGPYGDMRTSLRRLARGEELPDWKDLRGGNGE